MGTHVRYTPLVERRAAVASRARASRFQKIGRFADRLVAASYGAPASAFTPSVRVGAHASSRIAVSGRCVEAMRGVWGVSRFAPRGALILLEGKRGGTAHIQAQGKALHPCACV
jgi:hypothetical protein|eukprot:4309500-Prymnesium_polylepis.1